MTTLLFIVMVVYICILRRDRKRLNQTLFAMIGVTLEEKRHRLSYHAETQEVLAQCRPIIAPYEGADFMPEKKPGKVVNLSRKKGKKCP